jgi:RNA polymerase primary sigma factor
VEPLTLEEIGLRLGITRERVRQIKEKALSRLRHVSNSRALESFYVS